MITGYTIYHNNNTNKKLKKSRTFQERCLENLVFKENSRKIQGI